MRFQVPQFIDVEDKIFGPLTLKQFIYLAGGGGLCFLIYVILDSVFLATIPMILVMAGSAALAFYKVNNKPLVSVIEYAFKYWLGSKLYVWRKEDKIKEKVSVEKAQESKKFASLTVPKISDSKLKDLSWSLDIKESIYSNKNQR